MHVELYEKIWMWAATGLLVLFVGVMIFTALNGAVQPPSHMETVDPKTISSHPEFGNPGVTTRPDGSAVAVVVGGMFNFSPDPIKVPANRPVTFRMTSTDVMHGFEVVGTNANAMMIPGYVTQFTVIFNRPGEYLIGCNEYCGLMHHNMVGKLIVK
jgi:cytochrome c oxidase subunit 2